MRTLVFGLSALVLTAAGLLGSAAAADGRLPVGMARYAIRRGKAVEHLEVVRLLNRIEHRYEDRGVVEVWKRHRNGELEHWKVFPREGRSVHYTAGDLRIIHLEPQWRQLAGLIDPKEFTRPTSETKLPRLTVFEGRSEQVPARVLWDSHIGWAKEIAIGASGVQTRFDLLESHPCANDGCAAVNLKSMREIEFADLGDLENDPFVRNFLAHFAGHARRAGSAHGH